MLCVQGVTSIPTVPNRANLKCRGIFATGPKTFTCFRNLKASKGGGSALHRMHLPALARTFCLIKFAIGFLPFNGLRTTIRQPVLEAHKIPQKPSQEFSEISHRGLSRAQCPHDDRRAPIKTIIARNRYIAPRLTVKFFASAKRNIGRFKTQFVQTTRSIHIKEMKSGLPRKLRPTKPLTQLYSRDSQPQLKSYGG